MPAKKPRTVIDTNVWVSVLLAPRSVSAANRLADKIWSREFLALASTACFLEYEEVMRRPYLGLDDVLVNRFLDALAELMQWHDPAPAPVLLRDAGDQKWLNLLHGSRADALVTYNLRDFRPALERGYPVMPPAEALRVLAGTA